MKRGQAVIFFDGICNLCNGAVDWVLKRDKEQFFRFSSLQSEFAKKHLPKERTESLETVVVETEDGKILLRSEAALYVLSMIYQRPWIYSWGMKIPHVLRDGAYQLIARSRYQIFGQRETCRLPTPQERERFLE